MSDEPLLFLSRGPLAMLYPFDSMLAAGEAVVAGGWLVRCVLDLELADADIDMLVTRESYGKLRAVLVGAGYHDVGRRSSGEDSDLVVGGEKWTHPAALAGMPGLPPIDVIILDCETSELPDNAVAFAKTFDCAVCQLLYAGIQVRAVGGEATLKALHERVPGWIPARTAFTSDARREKWERLLPTPEQARLTGGAS